MSIAQMIRLGIVGIYRVCCENNNIKAADDKAGEVEAMVFSPLLLSLFLCINY